MLKSSFTPDLIEAGCDEVGRGCLAGPVTASAVILPKDYKHKDLNDSKVLSLKKREKLRKEIESDAVAWAVCNADHKEIDRYNIVNASFMAMHRAIKELKTRPQLLLVDGKIFNGFPDIPHKCIVKGDSKYLSIAAASILAKSYRDELMTKLNEEFPGYFWDQNAGYPTKEHKAAIKALGITPHHRRSYQLIPSQMELFGDAEN